MLSQWIFVSNFGQMSQNGKYSPQKTNYGNPIHHKKLLESNYCENNTVFRNHTYGWLWLEQHLKIENKKTLATII